jgi:hypothetical protein
MKLTLYEAIFDEDLKGVFGISLVESPATKETFIQLSEQEQEALKQTQLKLATINEEQRLLVGLVLEPNSPVYRNQDGEEFNIIFSEDTITKLAHNFFKSDSHKNSSLEHSTKILGVTFVESWLVADPKKDKSNVYGLEYPAGSWLVAMKVDSDEIWNDYVKTGKVTGFSIDAIVKLKEVKNKTELSMSKIIETLKEVSDKLAIALKLKETPEVVEEVVEVKLGQVIMEGGEIIFEYEGETPEPGANVFAVDKTDMENKIPAPVGKYPLEDGSILIIEEEGVIGSITPKEGEPVEPAKPVEPVAAADEAATVANDIKSILIKYGERFDKIEKQITEMNKEVVEMSEQPNAKPRTAPVTVALNKNGRILEKIRNSKN